jgi:hypothetical protein
LAMQKSLQAEIQLGMQQDEAFSSHTKATLTFASTEMKSIQVATVASSEFVGHPCDFSC